MRTSHPVVVDGAVVGVVAYSTSADLWHEGVEADHDAAVASYRHCAAHPESADVPHALRWAEIEGEFRMLYCPACRVLVTPPYDGYDYQDYPAEWLAVASG